jgi:hypothetical protein
MLLACLASSQLTDSIPSPPIYDDADAYDVYSAALPMDRWYWDSSKTLLILQTIPPSEWPIGSPRGALQGDLEFQKSFAAIFDSFDKANQKLMVLEHHFSIPKPYRLITKREIETAFRRRAPNAVDDGWEGFRAAFPDCSGYLVLSGVGFNPDKTMALVYVGHSCGGLCAQERYYILRKRDGHWVSYKPKGLRLEMTGES